MSHVIVRINDALYWFLRVPYRRNTNFQSNCIHRKINLTYYNRATKIDSDVRLSSKMIDSRIGGTLSVKVKERRGALHKTVSININDRCVLIRSETR